MYAPVRPATCDSNEVGDTVASATVMVTLSVTSHLNLACSMLITSSQLCAYIARCITSRKTAAHASLTCPAAGCNNSSAALPAPDLATPPKLLLLLL
jgi:hypothetical protein